ncbi:MAG TPA: hypothetical protein VGD79_07380, partial [Thermoanaerobaculia bacterium]
ADDVRRGGAGQEEEHSEEDSLLHGDRSSHRNAAVFTYDSAVTPRLREQHPNEPWLWRDDWAQRTARESAEIGGSCLWGFTIVWLLFSLPMLWFIPREWPPNARTILFAAFPVVGLLLLLLAIYQTLRRFKYGASVVRLDRVPIPVGSTLRGEIDVRLREQPAAGFALRLVCLRHTVTGTGKSRSVHESVLWQDEQTVTHGAMPSPNGLRVPFRFDIPWEAEPADPADPENLVIWRLYVSADVPGIDYQSFFELPVFRTESARDELAPHVHSPAAWQPPAEIRIGPDSIVVRPARTIGDWIAPVVFFPLWFGALALMRAFGVPLFVLAFFALIGLLVALVILDFLLGRTTITANRTTFTLHRTWLGLGRRRAVPSSEVVRVEPVIGSTFGNRGYHDVRAVLRDGRTMKVARHLRNRKDAEMLGERLAQALGVDPSRVS